jgi:hypothetical protein
MKNVITQTMYTLGVSLLCLTACRKDRIPPVDPNPNPKPIPKPPGNSSVETIDIQLQAVITIGTIVYDSIPANFRILSWDAQGAAYQKDTLLPAGAQKVPVPKGHSRYQLSMNQWGISDVMDLTKDQLQTDVVYTLGGQKAAKRLLKEESFLFVMGNYQPKGKTLYTYNAKGVAVATYYQKLPEHAELQLTQTQRYTHTGNNVTRIDFTNSNGSVGYTAFEYNAQGTKVTNIRDVQPGGETGAAVEYGYATGGNTITIDYLFDNGHSMEYTMQFKGGNKVQDAARTSRNGGEGGTYTYDKSINPYAHMNMPNRYLSNLSRNNMIGQDKGYSGGFPTVEVYKFEYRYDAEGYPVELVKYYKNFLTGEEAYKVKTVYTY